MTLLYLMLDRDQDRFRKEADYNKRPRGPETAEWVDVKRFGPEVVQMLGGAEQRSARIR